MNGRNGKQTKRHDDIRRVNPLRMLRAVGILTIWFLIWQGVYLAVGKDVLFASPVQVAVRFAHLVTQWDFWQTVATTLGRIMAGLTLGILVGVGLAILTSASRLVSDFCSPLVGMVKSTPVTSFIVLAMLWIARGRVPVFISFLMVLPIIWANVSEGIRRRDAKLLEMAAVFRMGRMHRLRRVDVPMVLPYFMAAFNSALGLAWKAGITAEVLSNPAFSIGGRIYDAKVYLETTDLFVWTAVLVLISVGLEKLFLLLIRHARRKLHIRGEVTS